MRVIKWFRLALSFISWKCSIYYRACEVLRAENSRLESRLINEESDFSHMTSAYKEARARGRECEELRKKCKRITRHRDCLRRNFTPTEYMGMDVFVVLNEIVNDEIAANENQ